MFPAFFGSKCFFKRFRELQKVLKNCRFLGGFKAGPGVERWFRVSLRTYPAELVSVAG